MKAETVGLKPATIAEWGSHLRNHLVPEFGPLQFQRISRERIQRYVARLVEEKKLSPKSIRNIFVPLHRLLRDAVTDNYLRINPASGVKKPKLEKKKLKEGRDFLHPEEVARLCAHAEPSYRTLFYMAAVSGIRQGELLALRWSDIRDSKVTVERTLHWRSKQIGGAGPRAKLRRVDFHSLRHSYAAMQIKNNVSLKYLQAQLGHSSIEVTLDVYGHLLPDVGSGAADNVEALLANNLLTKEQRLR